MVLAQLLISLAIVALVFASSRSKSTCRFAPKYSCSSFQNPAVVDEYLDQVMFWEGQGFAQPGIGYDAGSGYTYDGHPLTYSDATLFGEPHLFSAPSKESIHIGILALAVAGNKHAQIFTGGLEGAIATLELKMKGLSAFNATYPGYGCFHPWVGFNLTAGTFAPLESWSYKVPGLDNGEMFWSVYAVVQSLEKLGKYPALTASYRGFMECQRRNAKTIFYRGNGDVSAVVDILDPFVAPTPENYKHNSGYLNDPYEGETLTQMLYLFSDWGENTNERELLWEKKRGLFSAVNYTIPASVAPRNKSPIITVQRGWWFSTHEQWKILLLPYISPDLPLVERVFRNAEKARTYDAVATKQPGFLASINDVTNGAQEIPDYISAAGVPELAYEAVDRRDVITPYGSFGLMMFDKPAGLCWYNNMLSGPRMQSRYGSTEAINVNGTEISPITTWDSKITTVLAMLGGVGEIVGQGLRTEKDAILPNKSSYQVFVDVVSREHERVFGAGTGFTGDDATIQLPATPVPQDKLSDWANPCGDAATA